MTDDHIIHPVVLAVMCVTYVLLCIYFVPVLSVMKATSDSLMFNWEASGEREGTTYELQLRLVSTERDFTQVRDPPTTNVNYKI